MPGAKKSAGSASMRKPKGKAKVPSFKAASGQAKPKKSKK